MADDATAFDGTVEAKHEDTNGTIIYISIPSVGTLAMALSDLPTARVGDKVQVAIFLRPSE